MHGNRDEVTLFVNQLEQNGFATRAAAIAVFHLHIRLAIEVLNRSASKGTEGSLQIVAMALSGNFIFLKTGASPNLFSFAGYSDDKNSIWRELCQPTKSNPMDPYLRAMFAFLTADKENYETVLVINLCGYNFKTKPMLLLRMNLEWLSRTGLPLH